MQQWKDHVMIEMSWIVNFGVSIDYFLQSGMADFVIFLYLYTIIML